MQDKPMKKNILSKQQPKLAIHQLLGGISPAKFIAEYWQKKPLLIRQAIPGFTGLLSANELAGLACDDDVQSRIVQFKSKKWHLSQGPFDEDTFARLPEKDWTLLVQSVNHHLEEASTLLQRFNFIPHARLDDLMVSYAPDGGGVGPHFDSYDVFLLQGLGQRLWRISEQTDLTLVEGAPLKILKQFATEQEFLLNPGDMLYLPPKVAHWGIAVGECMTYSIGFRAPAMQELAAQFMLYMQEHMHIAGMVADPDLKLQKHPAKLHANMVGQVAKAFKQIKWGSNDIAKFLGCYLSEPKAHIVFDVPKRRSLESFTQEFKRAGIALSLKSQALFYQHTFFMNGESIEMNKASEKLLKCLADSRQLSVSQCVECLQKHAHLVPIFHAWYMAGYIVFNN